MVTVSFMEISEAETIDIHEEGSSTTTAVILQDMNINISVITYYSHGCTSQVI